jgi:hypothetical protein
MGMTASLAVGGGRSSGIKFAPDRVKRFWILSSTITMPRQDFSFIIKNVNKSICLLRFFMLQEATVRSYANCFALVPCLYLRHNECELYRMGHRCREPYLRNPTPKKKPSSHLQHVNV